MPGDPFATLGLGPGASADDVRDARRRLALQHHPDRGGDAAAMRIVNEAADAALALIGARAEPAREHAAPDPVAPDPVVSEGERGVSRDVPSFTVEALPAETFEALVLVAANLGDVLDDDPPYRLDTYLRAPYDCWCRLDVLPDAGASTVSLTVAGIDGGAVPTVTAVRNAWVADLNALDWPT